MIAVRADIRLPHITRVMRSHHFGNPGKSREEGKTRGERESGFTHVARIARTAVVTHRRAPCHAATEIGVECRMSNARPAMHQTVIAHRIRGLSTTAKVPPIERHFPRTTRLALADDLYI